VYLIVRGGRVLRRNALECADLLIERDTIAGIGPALPAPEGARVIDASGSIVMPGLINGHTHAHNNLMKGMHDNLTLEELRAYGPALLAERTPEDQYVSAAIGAIEMLRTGCTAAFDMFTAAPVMTEEGIEAVVRAYRDVGLRAVLAPSMNDLVFYRSIPGLLELLPSDLRRSCEAVQASPPERLLRITEDAVRRWDGGADGLIRVAASPAVPGECSDEYLAGLGDLVRRYGIPLQTHLAETKIQAVGALHRWDRPLVHQLADLGLIDSHFVGGHGVWTTEEEMHLLGDAGAAIVHNPASNLRLGSGIAPIAEMRRAGVTVGLGSDGSLSSDNQNMFEAMRFAALVSKVRFAHDPEHWLAARDVREIAMRGSAAALGLADVIGALEPGYKADLVLLRAASPFLTPLHDIDSALVYMETGADVETVLVGGRIVLEHGRVTTVNETGLLAKAQAAADRLTPVVRGASALADRLVPFLRATCRTCAALPHPANRYAVPAG
jgi:5-methylthioadenosine/S-adenosylhomocysteine deaminase